MGLIDQQMAHGLSAEHAINKLLRPETQRDHTHAKKLTELHQEWATTICSGLGLEDLGAVTTGYSPGSAYDSAKGYDEWKNILIN